MNKTQINYMNERLSIIERQLLEKFNEKYPAPEKLSPDDKLGMIINGEVELNYDYLTDVVSSNDCPYWLPNAIKLFDFSDINDLYSSKNAAHLKIIYKFKEKISAIRQNLLDGFVLAEKKDTTLLNRFLKTKI